MISGYLGVPKWEFSFIISNSNNEQKSPTDSYNSLGRLQKPQYLLFINRVCFSYSKILRPRFWSTGRACCFFILLEHLLEFVLIVWSFFLRTLTYCFHMIGWWSTSSSLYNSEVHISACKIPIIFERVSPSNFRTQGSFICIKQKKIRKQPFFVR